MYYFTSNEWRFNPIQEGHFWDCLWMGGWGKERPPPKNLSHILLINVVIIVMVSARMANSGLLKTMVF